MSTFLIKVPLLVLLLHSFPAECSRILFYSAFSGPSHRIAMWPLVEKLAERGHAITFLSAFPPKVPNPNVTDFEPKALVEWMKSGFGGSLDFVGSRASSGGNHMGLLPVCGFTHCQALVTSSEFRAWAVSSHFDLVFLDTMYQECGYGLAHLSKAPVILIGTASFYPPDLESYGAPIDAATIPGLGVQSGKDGLTFLQRVQNTLSPIYWSLRRAWIDFPEVCLLNDTRAVESESVSRHCLSDKYLVVPELESKFLIGEYLYPNRYRRRFDSSRGVTGIGIDQNYCVIGIGTEIVGGDISKSESVEKLLRTSGIPGLEDMPSIVEMERKVSLVFSNTHYSMEYARSLPPSVVPIGGMHLGLKSTKPPLPKDMEAFIEESDGFVLVSFGTLVPTEGLPSETVEAMIRAFQNSKVRFIWKWNGEPPLNIPSNVLLAEWTPQQTLLSHPKIKGFITHGGLLSTQESVFMGVPLIVVPFFGDQDVNAATISKLGYGVTVEIVNLQQKDLHDAIKEITSTDKYKERLTAAASIVNDRPMHAVDTALWWTEFVIRHKGKTGFLQPLSVHQNWFRRRVLDVWLFLVATLVAIIWILFNGFRTILRYSVFISSSKLSKKKRS